MWQELGSRFLPEEQNDNAATGQDLTAGWKYTTRFRNLFTSSCGISSFSLSQTFTILLQVHNQVSLSDFQCHLKSFGGLCNPQEQSSLMLSRFLDSFQVSFLLLHLLFSFHADYFFIHRNLLSIYRHSNNCLII